jgi:hypothetical protein
MGGRRKPVRDDAPDPARGGEVLKTIWPHQHGAIKLARRYGDALVCVRYRRSPNGRLRVTTVELAIEETPVRRRWVAVRLPWSAGPVLRTQLENAGAQWDARQRVWIMPRRTAERFDLEAHIDIPPR